VLLFVSEKYNGFVDERGLQRIPKERRRNVAKRLSALSKIIQDRRIKLGFTQEQLAEELDISFQ